MYKNLETSGFIVIRNFLTKEEMQPFLDEYTTICDTSYSNKNYQLHYISPSVLYTVSTKVQAVLQEVTKETNIKTDLLLPAAMYADASRINFPWHQDYEHFYVLQQSYNYLNFYIPIVKEDPDQSGICVLPFDRIAQVSESAFSTLVNNGASNFFINNSVTEVARDNTSENFTIDVDIETLKETPSLNPGDLLLLRGDTIHRTQDSNTKRVAISIRATDGNAVSNKFKIIDKIGHKRKMIDRNKQFYDYVYKLFGNDEELTARELYSRFLKEQ